MMRSTRYFNVPGESSQTSNRMILSKMMKQNVDHDRYFKFLSTNDNFYLEAHLKMLK
jgi:hypothetical protein